MCPAFSYALRTQKQIRYDIEKGASFPLGLSTGELPKIPDLGS